MPEDELLSSHLQELRRGTVVLACLLILRRPNYGYTLLDDLEKSHFAVVGDQGDPQRLEFDHG